MELELGNERKFFQLIRVEQVLRLTLTHAQILTYIPNLKSIQHLITRPTRRIRTVQVILRTVHCQLLVVVPVKQMPRMLVQLLERRVRPTWTPSGIPYPRPPPLKPLQAPPTARSSPSRRRDTRSRTARRRRATQRRLWS